MGTRAELWNYHSILEMAYLNQEIGADAHDGSSGRRRVANCSTIAQNTYRNLSWVKGSTKAGFALHRHYWLFVVIRERQLQWICAVKVQAAVRTDDMCACHYLLSSGSVKS